MFFRKISFHTCFLQPIIFWLAVVCVSFAAGFFGGSITGNDSQIQSTLETTKPVIFQDRTRGASPVDSFSDENLASVRQSMLAVYDDAQRAVPGKESYMLPLAPAFRGYALALTTDGWLVTTIPIEKSPKSYRIISKSGTVYSVVSVIPDFTTGVSFVKIAAKNLRPIQFSKFSDHASLRQALLLNGWNSAEYMMVGPASYPHPLVLGDYIHSTLVIDKRILPERSFALQCLPVLSDSLEVLGCTAARGVISFQYLQSALGSVLRNGSLLRPALALHYIDLSQAPLFLGPSDNPQVGAYLQLDSSPRSLVTSEGREEKLTVGDTITHINDQAVDVTRNLAELLSQYQKGDTVSVRIRSKKGNRDIQIKL